MSRCNNARGNPKIELVLALRKGHYSQAAIRSAPHAPHQTMGLGWSDLKIEAGQLRGLAPMFLRP